MSLERIETYLRESIGLDASSLGTGLLPRAVRRQMQVAGLTDEDAYLAAVVSDGGLRQALIEALVVPETWFFRNGDPFQLLARLAMRERAPGRPLHVLCLPCSTGEEAYSIAITLLQAGLSAGEFTVDALDISEVSLEAARRAHYGPNSFRDGDRRPPARWFEPVGEQWRPVAAVREAVSFRHANIFTFAPARVYDVVFCRNLLIYFDVETQSAALARLRSVMDPEGVLFLGHAEASVALRAGMSPLPDPRCFAFVRKPVAASPAPVEATPRPAPRRPVPPPPAAPRPFADVALVAARPEPQSAVQVGGHLERAAGLADQGRLDEAAALVRADLADRGPTAAAYCLLGVIHDAAGRDAEAESAYRKALYLDSNHAEAIAHLALLLEKRGSPEAARLWSRARRPLASGRGGDA